MGLLDGSAWEKDFPNGDLNLNKLRGDIDIVDSAILDLLQKRGELVLKVAEYKKQNDLFIVDFKRELDHIEFLKKLNKGPYRNNEIQEIFEKIFAVSKALQSDYKAGDL